MATNHYDLKFLESTTNLRPLVKKAFGREPNAKVARDIAVSIQQGRLFFEQAEASPVEIKPLLVYYGVLSFARALTAAVKNKELSTLEQSHGLKDVGSLVRYRPQIWQHAISKSATANSPADDRSLSLVEQFIDGVLTSFPRLIVNSLDSQGRD